MDRDKFINSLKEKVSGHYRIANGAAVKDIEGDGALPSVISGIDGFIKNYISENGGSVDYIHGEENLFALVKADKNSVGVMPDGLNKSSLFRYVSESGSLPRKTFSMGEGVEKRYYLEAKKIRK